ncbi:2'-deoxymugineic-acid 2'-dioxygenase [Platanthera guangdongensis]|uniref:2'-deoxymugineic-acid 2'-dioxygenase n=1 Tax=Platanthera guangdongensis TaxID=2320717 RepID=A0ABR2MYR8_9ASPA
MDEMRKSGIYTELLRALWESLGVSGSSVEDMLQMMESAATILVNNFYPQCPQPEAALGQPPHTDNCLVSIVMHSRNISSLQVTRGRKWVPVDFIPNSLFFIAGDILEVFHKYPCLIACV